MTIPSAKSELMTTHGIAAALALFLNAGTIKADPRLSWIPIDLTLVSGLILILVAMKIWFTDTSRVSGSQLLWTLGFLGLMIPGIFIAPINPYAMDKIPILLTLTPLSLAIGIILGQREGGLEIWVAWNMPFCILIMGEGLIQAMTSHGALRVTGIASNTISLGRAAGVVFLVMGMRFLIWPWEWMKQGLRLALVLASATALLFSGSRGPLLAALFALLLTLFIDRQTKTMPRLMVLTGLLFVGLASAWTFVPAGSLARITSFASGDFGGSALTRQVALDKAIPQILSHPFGIGWGGFMGQLQELAGEPRQYPHNLLAEAFLEGGWLTGFGIVYLMVASRARIARFAPLGTYALWMGLFVFFLFNALVSGDLNDNRAFFTVLGLGLGGGMRHTYHLESDQDSLELGQP